MSAHESSQEPVPQKILDTAIALWRRSEAPHNVLIEGNSMLPLIQSGDRVIFEAPTDGIRRGQIIVFQQGVGLVTHRVLSRQSVKGKTMLLTKGDNIPRPDPVVAEEAVIGRVVTIQRGTREMSLNSLTWRAAGASVATAMLIWSSLITRLLYGNRVFSTPASARVKAAERRISRALFGTTLLLIQHLCTRWRIIDAPHVPQ